jgi:hypothetical protein
MISKDWDSAFKSPKLVDIMKGLIGNLILKRVAIRIADGVHDSHGLKTMFENFVKMRLR